MIPRVLDRPVFLTANRGHVAAWQVGGAEVVFPGLTGDHGEEKVFERFVIAAIAEDLAEVEFEVAAEAGAELAIRSEAEFVAALAEVEVGHGSDKTDELVAAGDFIVAGGAVGFEAGPRDERAGAGFDETAGG